MQGVVGKSGFKFPGRGAEPRIGKRVLAAFFAWQLCGLLTCSLHAQQAQPDAAPIVQPGAPGSPSKQLPPSTTGHAPQRSQADVEFMQGMIMHHSQAVEMTALIPSNTDNPEVHLLGARISRSQSD